MSGSYTHEFTPKPYVAEHTVSVGAKYNSVGLAGDKYGVFLKTSISFAFPNGPVPQLTKWRVGGGGHTGDGFAGYQQEVWRPKGRQLRHCR